MLIIALTGINLVGFATGSSDEWEQISQNIDLILKDIDLSALDEYIKSGQAEYLKNYGANAKEIISTLINGSDATDFNSYINLLFSTLFDGVIKLVPLFAGIVAIGVISCIVNDQTATKVLVKSANDTVRTACILLTILLVSTALTSILAELCDCVNSVKTQSEIIMPILLTLTVIVGGSGTTAIFQPAAIFLSSGAIELVADFVVPITLSVIIFNFISRITPSITFFGASKMIKSLLKWIIGITVTVYSIFLGVQGTTSSLFDGILFKATKYLIGNSVPIVGNFLSGGVDLLSASGTLIRSSVGLSGIIMLIFQVAQPIINLLSFSFMLKFTASVIQPLGDAGLYGLVFDLSQDVEYFIAGLLMVAFMYVLIIMLVINSANFFI